MKKVLVTGAAGFLGSHICERFLKGDFKVVGMDNFITGSKENIEFLAQWKNFEFSSRLICSLACWNFPLEEI